MIVEKKIIKKQTKRRKQLEIVFQVLTNNESQRITPKNENLKLWDALDFYGSLDPLMFHNAQCFYIYPMT